MTPHMSQAPHHTVSPIPVIDTPDSAASSYPRRTKPFSRVYRLPIESLRESEYPRTGGVDPKHVKILCEKAEELPPILVHRSTMKVLDGRHRLHAARHQGRETIDVTYFEGTEREAFLISVESNVKHGLPLSLSDRKKAAIRILSSFPELSNRSIAAKVGLAHKTVGALRRKESDSATQPSIRVGLDGKVRPINPAEGRIRAREIITRNPEASLRDIAESAGVSAETVRDVRRKMQHGHAHTDCAIGGGTADVAEATEETHAEQDDIATALESLKKDPAVRYSSEGRALVRWLESRLIQKDDAGRLMRIPAHQAEKVATMARVVAAYWSDIALVQESRIASKPSAGRE